MNGNTDSTLLDKILLKILLSFSRNLSEVSNPDDYAKCILEATESIEALINTILSDYILRSKVIKTIGENELLPKNENVNGMKSIHRRKRNQLRAELRKELEL